MTAEPTLMGVAVANVGAIKAGRVLAYIAQWTIASGGGDRSLTVEQYAEKWLLSPRQAYRQQDLFRQAFPGEATPDRIVQAAGVLVRERATGRGQARKVQAALASAPFVAAA
jgi:hypothetical protein